MQLFFGMGKIYREPTASEVQGGTPMCKFSIAIPRSGETKNGTKLHDYFSCVAWGKVAERISTNFNKDDVVAVKGEFHSNSYTTKDGKKAYTVDLTISDIDKFQGEETNVADAQPIAEDQDENLPF